MGSGGERRWSGGYRGRGRGPEREVGATPTNLWTVLGHSDVISERDGVQSLREQALLLE